MAVLAALDDLAGIGALPVDFDADSAEGVRGLDLLTKASAAVLVVLEDAGVDVDGIEELADLDWAEHRRTALSAIVAEIAAKRLTVSAAPSVDPFTYGSPPAPQTLKLNRWEQRAILNLIPITADADSWFTP